MRIKDVDRTVASIKIALRDHQKKYGKSSAGLIDALSIVTKVQEKLNVNSRQRLGKRTGR